MSKQKETSLFSESLGKDNSIKRMLYWTVGNNASKTIYYLSKEKALDDVRTANKWMPDAGVVAYEMETEFNDGILEKLLNKELNHCMLPGFGTAKLIG